MQIPCHYRDHSSDWLLCLKMTQNGQNFLQSTVMEVDSHPSTSKRQPPKLILPWLNSPSLNITTNPYWKRFQTLAKQVCIYFTIFLCLTVLCSSQNQWEILIWIDLSTYLLKSALVQVYFNSGAKISGGGLPEEYDSFQFHLHWGNGSSVPGSEHTVDGKRYPMAVNIVVFSSTS